MNLIQLKEKLEALGYGVNLKSETLLSVGEVLEALDDNSNIFLFDMYCMVNLGKKGTFLVNYGTTNVQSRIQFEKEGEVITWIRKEFPRQP